MKLDRTLQLDLLRVLADTYPKGISTAAWDDLTSRYGEDTVRANALYLDGHGLINWSVVPAGFRVAITPAGLDFLADDGGLTAILGVVTVRLHDDTIKALVEAKIHQSDLPPAEKKRWLDQLRSLPADATKHLVLKLVEKGLEHGPGAILAIGTFLQSHARG